MFGSELNYNTLLAGNETTHQARGVLPIDTKAEIIIKTTLKHWKHIFNLRTAQAAHASMRELMIPLSKEDEFI